MKLNNFEEFIDDVIMKRGLDYYQSGHVENITKVDDRRFEIDVVGSQDYTVTIVLNEQETVIETHCGCPYDWGEYCKHQVAAFYTLRKMRNAGIHVTNEKKQVNTNKASNLRADKKPDLKTILTNLSKEELMHIIEGFSSEHPELERTLLYKYAPVKDDVAASKKMMRECINQYKYRGFIKWNDVGDALQGAYLTLEKANKNLAQGEFESTILLSQAVLSTVVGMLQYCDDSGGDVGPVIDKSLANINEAICSGSDTMNERLKEKLFRFLMKEASHRRYEGWEEWQFSLFESCIPLCDNEKRRSQLEHILDSKLEKIHGDSWSSTYMEQQIKLLQYEMIEYFDGDDKKLQFMNKHIDLEAFREKAIVRYLEMGDYLEVINLCEQGEMRDKELPGLVTKWKKYRLKAYEQLEDVKKQRELMLHFLKSGMFEYYLSFKKLYPENEWSSVLQQILENFEKGPALPSIYLQIVKEENMKDKILYYCTRDLSLIPTLYSYIVDDYFEEVNELFVEYIQIKADNANERRKYRDVCKTIKQYKKVSGADRVQVIIEGLKQVHYRRPAFLDELGKIK